VSYVIYELNRSWQALPQTGCAFVRFVVTLLARVDACGPAAACFNDERTNENGRGS